MVTIPWYLGAIPFLTTEQMREVDRSMIEDYNITLLQMMENAGRNLAHLARVRFFAGNPQGKQVVVLVGPGGNGGGALAGARRLHNYGAHVHIFGTTSQDKFTLVPRHQLTILQVMGMSLRPTVDIDKLETPDLIVDGIIGYSLQGSPRGNAAKLISWANDTTAPILSLDTPSGVDTTSGTAYTPAIRATATMTLALPKQGLRDSEGAAHVGELYLADISVPPALYARQPLALQVPHVFAKSDIVRLR